MLHEIKKLPMPGIQKAILHSFLIFSFLTIFCSCATSLFYESPNSFKNETSEDVKKIILKNKISVDCRNKSVNIEIGSGGVRFINIISADTVRASDKGYSYKTGWNKLQIPVKDVSKIQMEKKVLGVIGIVLIVMGVLAVAAIVALSSINFNFDR